MGPHYKDCHLGMAAYDGGVGHYLDGRTVDKHVVIILLELFHECGEAGGEEQFGGIGRDGAHGEHVELVEPADDFAIVVHLAREIVGYTHLGRVDIF